MCLEDVRRPVRGRLAEALVNETNERLDEIVRKLEDLKIEPESVK